jgi:hypothetical protein
VNPLTAELTVVRVPWFYALYLAVEVRFVSDVGYGVVSGLSAVLFPNGS